MFKQFKEKFGRTKKLAKKQPKSLHYEELEQRVLFSADIMPGLDNIAVEEQVLVEDVSKEVQAEREAASQTIEQTASQARSELVLVNENVADYEQLIADLQGSDNNRIIEVVVLESDRDGIEQVSEILSERSDLAAVHFISHGSDAEVQLGNTVLDAGTLSANTGTIQAWGEAFTQNGDILIYGCNLAATEDGQALVAKLGQLTGADVVASDDFTGSAELGGDWELEYKAGDIESSVAFSAQTQQSWAGLLADNLAPVNTVPGTQTTAEDTSLEFSSTNGNAITVSDADAGTNEIEVTLSVDNGTLELAPFWPSGSETTVNTTTTLSQQRVDSAYAANGNYVTVWASLSQDGDSFGIYAQVFDSSGNPVGGEIPVNTETAGSQHYPAVAMDDSGNFVVTWASYAQDKNNTWGVYAQRFDASGAPQGGEFLVNTKTTGDQTEPDVAMDSLGNFVVMWKGDGAGDTDGVFTQRYAADGTALGGETLVNTTTTDDQSRASIAMAANGDYVVAWHSANQDGDGIGVYAQRFSASGVPQGAEFQVAESTTGTQDAPSVAINDSGQFVIAWQAYNQGGPADGIYGRVFDANGTALTGEFQASQGSPTVSGADVAIDNDGNFVISWTAYFQAPDNSDSAVVARYYDATGTPVDDEFVVNTTYGGSQQLPSVSVSATGDFAIAWEGASAGDSGGVSVQRFESAASRFTFSVGDGSGDATMTFRGTIADINKALDGLVYTPDNGFNGTDTLTITTDDLGNTGTGGALQDVDTINITVGNPNTPVINLDTNDSSGAGGNDFTAAWAEGSGPAAVVDTDATLVDVDENVNLINIYISNPQDGADEFLSADPGATGLSVFYSAATHRLTISGSATAAQYQEVLRTVTYDNVSSNPSTTPRLITFTPRDSLTNGNTATTTLTMTAVNDAPVNTVPGSQTTDQDTDLVFSSGNGNAISVSDVDADTVEVTLMATNGTVSVSLDGAIGDETLINTTTTEDVQERPDIAVAADGSYVVTWASLNQDTDSWGIYAQRYDASGSAVGGEIQVHTSIAGEQENPAIAIDDSGNFVVAWQSKHRGTGYYEIFAQRFDANGVEQGTEFQVDMIGGADNINASVAMDADGEFVIAFEIHAPADGDGWGIYARQYDNTGTPLSGAFRVNATGTGNQTAPSVAMDDVGNYVVAWDSGAGGIFYQRYDNTGTAQGGEMTATTVGYNSQVATDGAGNFVIVWQNSDTSSWGIGGRRFGADGTPLAAEFQVNTNETDDQVFPDVAVNDSSEFVVTWQSYSQDVTDTYGVYAQRYDASGATVDGEFLVNTTTAGGQYRAIVGIDDAGRYTVAWNGNGDGDTAGVFTKRYGLPVAFTTGDGADDATMTFTGSVADINAALDGLTFTPTASYNGPASLQIQTNDLGQTGSGGTKTDDDTIDIAVGIANLPPTISLPGSALNYTEGDGSVVIDTAATVSDPDSANFDTGTLTVDFTANGTANDRLAIRDQGTGIGNIQVSGSNISYQPGGSSILIGTFSGGTDGSTPLVINLNAAADSTAVQALIRNITYENVSDNPSTATRTVRFQLTDGDGGTSTAVTKNINVAAVNDVPTNSIPGTQATPIDTPIILASWNGNGLSVNDPDASIVEVTLTATNGTIELNIAGAVDGESLLSTETASSQMSPAVAVAPDGSYVTTWVSDNQDGSGAGIYGQRFDATRNPLGGEFLVNTTTMSAQTEPAVAVDNAGNFVVVWTSDSQDGDLGGIYAQRFDSNGAALGSEFLVNTTTAGDQSHADVAMDSNGDFVITWGSSDQDGDSYGIFAQRFNAAGVAQASEFQVNSYTTSDQDHPAVAMDDAGNFVVVWQSLDQDGNSWGVYGQRFDANGTVQGSEFRVNQNLSSPQMTPDVAMDPSGNFVVTWHGSGFPDTVSGVFARLYNAAGTAQTGEIDVNETTADTQSHAVVDMDDAGNFVVGWRTYDQDGDTWGIQSRRFDASGSALTAEFQVNTTGSGSQMNPAIGVDSDGDFVVAWDGAGDGDTDGVFARRFQPVSLSFTNGDGSDDATMTFSGSIADVNTALEGLIFTPTASFTGSASIQIQTSDLGATGTGGTMTDDDTIDISVTAAVNNVPVITSDGGGATASINVAENSKAVTTVTASDADLDTPTFSITGGADAAKFDLIGGVLTFKTAPDFESPGDVGANNTYEVEVTADDGNGGTDVQTINVTVTNVAPTTLTTTGTGSVSDGGLYTLNLSADEDVTSWTINWGDGAIETIAGNPSSATHTYNGAGITHNILVAATDADGTYLQNELLVPTYYGGEGVLRFAPTTGQFVEQLAMGDGLTGHFDVQQGPDGNLYFTGYNSGNVLRYAPDGSFINTFVSAGSGGLNNATSLLFGPDGHLYVAGADSVLRYDGATGVFLNAFVAANSGGLSEPAGMEFGSDGNLYVASYNTHQVLRYNGSTGAFIDVFVSTGAGGLSSPEQITFGPDGNLYVANSGGDNVLRYNGTTGAFIDAFVATGAGGLDYTTGLAFGPDGNLYVTSQGTDNVLRYNGTTGAFIDEYVAASAGGLDVPAYASFLAEHQVTVTSVVNDAPTQVNNTGLTVAEGGTNTIGSAELRYDDAEQPAASVTYTVTGGLTNGQLELTTDLGTAVTSFTQDDIDNNRLVYVHDDSETTSDSFNFTVDDGQGNSVTGQYFAITVTPVNDAAPVATDDNYSVDEDNTLTADWWNTAWTRRQELTFDNSAQVETLTDFPVLVILNSSNIDYTQTKDDGSDLRFFASDGTPLAHEIEQWNEGGDSSVWVRVPQITGNSNSDSIWMYYGNSGAEPAEDVAGVWDGNFVGVWHLNEEQGGTGSAGVYQDSTSYGNTGIDRVAATGQDGQVTGGQEFGANDWIEVEHDASLDLTDSMTISFWIKPTSDSGTFNRVVEKGLWGYNDSYYFGGGNGTNDLTFYLNGQEVFDTPDDVLTVGEWQHAAVSYTSNGDGTGTARLYLNGVEIDSGNYTNGAVPGNTGRLAIGHSDPDYDFDGFIDEVQISDTDRSADWIAAQYQATKNQFGTEFVQFGGEESAPAVGGVLSNDTDVDHDPLTVTLVDGPDNAQAFTLNKDGTFTYTPSANYHGSDTFTYEVSDGNGGTAQATATITVNPINDAPVFSPTMRDEFSTAVFTNNDGSNNWSAGWVESDGAGAGASVGNIVITGGELSIRGNGNTITREADLSNASSATLSFGFRTTSGVESGDPDSVVIEVSGNGGGNWTVLETFDSFDGINSGSRSYDISGFTSNDTQIRLRVANGYGGPDEFFIVDNVQIQYANTVSVAENTTAVTTLTATDVDLPAQTLTYNIIGGDDAAKFTLDSNNGVLSFITAPDFELPTDLNSDNIYEITVQVSDGSLTDTQNLRVIVTDANEAPSVSLSNLTATLAEDTDTTAAIKVADITITDDALGTNNLSLTGTDAGMFTIVGNELFLNAGATLDFETNASLDVSVEVDDPALPATPEDSASMAISITDANEAPTVSLSNLTATLTEDTDTTAAIKVADITITDDALGTNNLSLTGADAGMFTIVGSELFLNAGATLDFETNASLDVTVEVDDPALPATPEDSASMAISITDVNEAPTVSLSNLTATLAEDTDTTAAIKVADITITDDALGTNNLSLTGADAGMFTIVGNELFLNAGATLDFVANPTLDVTVEVDDPALPATPEDSASMAISITDVNEAPSVSLSNLTATLAEDTDTTAAIKVADITITDDALGTNNLSLTGTDAGMFTIVGNELFLNAGATLDFETNASLDVTVEVDDPALPATPEDSASMAITITDANEAPTVSLSNLIATLAEDTDTTAAIKVADITITDDALGTNNLSLTGADAGMFTIVGNELFLNAGATLDFVANPTLDVTVEVDDPALPATPEDSASMAITITDANEAPTVSLSNLTATLAEDTDTTAAIKVADITITDDALGTNNLSLTGADAGMFTIVGNELFLNAGATLDFETNASLDFTVQVDDPALPATPEDSASMAISITDVNEAPTVSLSNLTATLTEDTDTTAAIKVADITITDDALGTNNLSLTGTDAGMFTIVGSELFLNAGATLDFETNASLDVTVEVDDPALPATPEDSASMAISITDVNEAPTVSLSNLTATLAEDTDTTAAIKVADITITDDALGTNNLSLTGADAGMFTIVGNELFLNAGATLDFVANPTLDVTVEVDDPALPATPEDSASMAITITDANEAPTVSLSNLTATLAEDTDTTAAIKVADITITDDALGTNNLSLTGADAGMFTIVGSELFLNAGATLDFETNASLDVTVEVDDPALPATPEDSASMAISITDANEAPTVSLSNLTATLAEDTDTTAAIKVADITITDDALGTNNLSLTGTDAGMFTIVGSELFLNAGATLDFETNASLDVSVEVDDPALPATPEDSASMAITITDANEAPTVSLSNLTATLAEDTDTTAAIKVADITITDDALGTNNLSLTGADAGMFTIVGNELFLNAGATLDFETNASLDVTVEVDDPALPATPEDSASMAISITDVNEAPTVSLSNLTATLAEDTDTTAAIKVADITITDDALGTNNLSLTGADAGMFTIVGNELFLNAGATLDFETNASLDVTVEVDDPALPATPEDSASMAISITDVNEAPSVSLSNLTATLAEDTDTTAAIKVADITITDDALGTNNLSLTGADAGMFTIVGNELFLNAGATLDFETNASLDVTVEVDDPALPATPEDSASMAITITDANEAPTVSLSNLTATLAEDTDTTAAIKVADITITDDALGTNNLSLTGADAGMFTIVGSELFLNAGATLDFETNASLDVTVQVDDPALPATPEDSASMAISITDVNEAPTAAVDSISGNEDTVVVDNILGNDSDVDGDALTASTVSGPSNGNLTLNADGSFSYTPNANWNGTDSFTYIANDGALDSNVAAVTITVNPVNDVPTVTSSAVTAATEDAAYSYTITTGDVDGDALTITAPVLPTWLTLADNGDGTATLSGTPTNAEVGDHSVVLQVSDSSSIDTQNFTVNVSGTTIDPPVVDTDPGPIFEDPEPDDDDDSDVDVSTREEPDEDPLAEDESVPPVEDYPIPEDSSDADDSIVLTEDPEAQETEEIIYLTDEVDTDIQSEEREDDSSYTYFDNDLYKVLTSAKHLNFNSNTPENTLELDENTDFGVVDFASDDWQEVVEKEDYIMLREEIDETFSSEQQSNAVKAKIVTASMTTFTVGIVSYFLRAGAMVSSLMSSLPLWRGFDPIAIFAGKKKRQKDRNEIPNTDKSKAETLFDGEGQ